jgi:hypothetical protein
MLVLLIILVLIYLFLVNKKEKFEGCTNVKCAAGYGLPAFVAPRGRSEFPAQPAYSIVPNTFDSIDTRGYKPVQWVSPNKTAIVGGYGGIGDISGVNVEFMKDLNNKVTFKTYTGI